MAIVNLKKYAKHRFKSKIWLRVMTISVIVALLPVSLIYYELIEPTIINTVIAGISLTVGSLMSILSIRNYWMNSQKQTNAI